MYKNPLISQPGRPLPKEVAVIGAGTIGPDIGYFFKYALPDLKLTFVDIRFEALDLAKSRIENYIQKARSLKKLSDEEARAVGSRMLYTTDYSDIGDCDLIIEAVSEELNTKKKVFAEVERYASDNAIITSNTSAIPAKRLFSELRNKRRATVTHFFAPAWRNEAVEIIDWEGTDKDIVDYLSWMFCSLGKVPFITKDEVCFMLDRVFDNWCNESALLLDRVTSSEIDKVAGEFVFAGPFYVLNFTKGNLIIYETNTLQMEEGEHYRPANIFRSVKEWNTEIKVETSREKSELIKERLLGTLFSQSFDIVDREIGSIADLNLGCQVGLGFRKGPFDVMRDLGERHVRRIIENFQRDRPGMPGPKKDFSYYQNFYRHILVDEIRNVKIITIRRPQVRNALNNEVNDEILSVMKGNEASPHTKGFVIVGYGPSAFCSGADIGRFPQLLGDAEAAAQYARECSKLLRYIDHCSKPVVAAVNGYALGGGFELIMRCHMILATENAWFQFPEVTLGILPGLGGLVVPFRRWGKSAFSIFQEAIRFARRISAREAFNIGVVTKVERNYSELIKTAVSEVNNPKTKIESISDEPVEIGVVEAAEEPMAGDLPLSRETDIIICKVIEKAAAAKSFSDALEIGYKAFGEVACTKSAKEGIGAFLEKRKPEFKKI